VCETLDIRLQLRSGLVVGEPDRQVEVVWSSERDIDTGARLSFLVGGSPVAVPSEVARSGSRVVVSSRAPVALLARYGSETRPTIVVSGRKIELSERQTRQLHGLLQHLPPYRVVRRGGAAATASRSTEARKRLDAADPAAGNGWFCVEAPGDSPRQRTSSCHRTSAECEQRRASLGAAAPAGDCAWSSTASCYVWQRPAKSGRSCFYRPSQCQRDKMIRDEAEQQPGSLWTSACYSAP
jgi:hypothetical protein